MEQEGSLKSEIRELKELMADSKPKSKKFRLPFMARLSRGKVKKGYVTVAVVNENKAIAFTREPIIDGTIKVGETYHAVKDEDLLLYKNKPFLIQAKSKLNPCNPLSGNNETYGQKYVMARMEGDRVLTKKKIGGWAISIIGLIIAAVVGYALLTG